MNYEGIINEFFECYNCVNSIGIINIYDNDEIFLFNNHFISSENENDSNYEDS